MQAVHRRLPIGAELAPEGGVHFRVWAPRRRRVEVVIEGGGAPVTLAAEAEGYFSGRVATARAGTRYRFRLDGGQAFPDPASRAQPEGPHGPSEVVDPSRFRWTDEAWRGVTRPTGQVIYELHIGTFTREGTYAAAARELNELAGLGVTIVELMPLAEFAGRFGWGYDGVDLFAPSHLYGSPDDLRAFVDAAHAAGVAVILDVVYNHFGPSGNYWTQYAQEYHSTKYKNEWGEPINFDGERSGPVRELFVANARHWIEEYHLDGFRFDATQSIHDASPEPILAEIVRTAREAAGARGLYLVGENEPQQARAVRPIERGGWGLDAVWNDDFHHTARVAATGGIDAYYADYKGTPQELISAQKWGFLYQGQWYRWQKKRRGTPALDVPAHAFVAYLENHDQVANEGLGTRTHERSSPGRWRALTALLLLGPETPLLFQGQEFAASAPFRYFADHEPELARLVAKGRREFVSQFRATATPEMQALLPEPHDHATFERSKLDLGERERHAEVYALHRDLLRLRREDPVFASQRADRMHGAVLGAEAFLLRFLGERAGDDRLLLVNLGADLHLDPSPEPLLCAPERARWETIFSTADPRYGGCGTPPLERENENWRIPGHAAVALAARDAGKKEDRRG
jgi:maltooligosyltrehalose trehalohydrolase